MLLTILVTVSILELFIWPLCFQLAKGRQAFLRFLDYSVIFSLFAILLIFVIPEIYHELGLSIVVPFLLGFLIPIAIEHYSTQYHPQTERVFFVFLLVGLSFHAIFDGITLAFSDSGHGHELPYAVLIHRLPVGLVIWRIFSDSKSYAFMTYGGIAIATIIGSVFGLYFIPLFSIEQITYIEAFISGFLLHIAFDVLKQNKCAHS